MHPVLISHMAWQESFPHVVAPLPDEWLPGLLLRCDEVNRWSSGTTSGYLLGSTKLKGFGPRSHWIVVPSPLLERLTQVVRLPQERLLATTYQAELARLYGLLSPYGRLLTTKPSFHLCPACVTQSRLLKRTLMLPHLNACPLHDIELQNRCQCGVPLVPFSRSALPFTCLACGLDWAHLPQLQLSVDRVVRERHLGLLYEFFLVKGTPGLRDCAWEILRMHERATSTVRLRRSHKYARPYGSRVSLEYLVEQMVNAGFSSTDILTYW